jgi:hypothetical protein
MGKGVFMVRAQVADAADRPAFDRWYETEHLPDALRAFAAERAWRCWSRTDPSLHFAFYLFASPDAVQAALDSEAMRSLIADFNRAWPRVTRSREVLEMVQDEAG